MSDHIARLRIFANEKNIPLPEDIELNTSKYVRFGTSRKDKDYFYRFSEIEGQLFGWFGTWKGGKEVFRFQSWEGENTELDKAVKEIHLNEDEEIRLLAETAAEVATAVWENAPPASEAHPYLIKKGIPPIGEIRSVQGVLILPLRNSKGEIRSLQNIDAYGEKRFSPGSKISGCWMHIKATEPSDRVFVAEGYATAVSVFMATGEDVIVAFSASSIMDCVKEIKKKFRRKSLVLAADDDDAGLKVVSEWKKKGIGGVFFPQFENDVSGKDFNDLHVSEGLSQVQKSLGFWPDAGQLSLEDFLHKEFPPIKHIWDDLLESGSLNAFVGDTGTGKSRLVEEFLVCASRGDMFLGKKTEKSSVLLIDAEHKDRKLQDRLRAICARREIEFANMTILTRSGAREIIGETLNLFDSTHRRWIDRKVAKHDIIAIDTYSSACPIDKAGGWEKEALAWKPLEEWALNWCERGKTFIFTHHTNNEGQQRGTSLFRVNMSTIIGLRKTEEINHRALLCSWFHIDKGRDIPLADQLKKKLTFFEQPWGPDAAPNFGWALLQEKQ